MKVNLNNIRDIYGDSVVLLIRDNIDDVMKNIDYLNKLNFTDTEDIFEKIAILFLDTPSTFKNKIDNLIKALGNDYVDIMEKDTKTYNMIFSSDKKDKNQYWISTKFISLFNGCNFCFGVIICNITYQIKITNIRT